MVSSDTLSSPSLSTVLPSEGTTVHGFKEWSLVCEALGAGAQSLILRKGGIHEGRGGFWWRHGRFLLFPTHFHEQREQFPWSPPKGSEVTGPAAETDAVTHTLEFLAVVDFKHQITSWEAVAALEPFHFWTEETVRARFDYSEETGISLAFLRVYQLAEPWIFPDQRNFGGCRSWLDLPKPPEGLSVTPVLDDASHQERRQAVRGLLGLQADV